jgi:hypothetical protein
MDSQKHEEVRKRRAKATTTRFNLYQKMVLVAGGLTLFSLAAGISPRLGPLLVAGVVGGMVVLFLIVKTCRRRREEAKDVQQEAFPAREESIVPQPILDPPDSIPGPLNSEGLQENRPPEAEEAVEEDDINHLQGVAREGVLAQILERLASAEGKVSRLEDRVMDLEEKVAGYEEGQLKSESKIDLQTILAHLDEKKGKFL